MVEFADPLYTLAIRSFTYRPVIFSPDGGDFVFPVRRGDVASNATLYSLLLFHTDDAMRGESSPPRVLASVTSKSNEPGIASVQWLDNRRVAYLGEGPKGGHQVMVADISTGQLWSITDESRDVLAFIPANEAGVLITVAAESPKKAPITDKAVWVSDQPLWEVAAGELENSEPEGQELRITSLQGHGESTLIRRGIAPFLLPPWPSPDGQHLVAFVPRRKALPSAWMQYEASELRQFLKVSSRADNAFAINQLVLIDTKTGEQRPLIDAPATFYSVPDVCWKPDSRTLVVTGTYLPLTPDLSPEELATRRTNRFAAELDLASGQLTPIARGDFVLTQCNWSSKIITMRRSLRRDAVETEGPLVAYAKVLGHWQPAHAEETNGRVLVTLKEDLNHAPKLYATNPSSGQTVVLLDLNPQLSDIQLGRVEDLTLRTHNGEAVHAGVYFPPGFVAGRRYPLVIQTHGWNPGRFWVDGPTTSAFAAQALAARDIVVAQLEEFVDAPGTAEELQREQSAYNAAIDYLTNRGVIDRRRVGLIGFSRTGISVKNALVGHAQFAAATVADGSDGGYFRYISGINAQWASIESESYIGASPFGNGLPLWLRRSPGFHLDSVDAPVRQEAYYASSLFSTWEWFAGLKRLGRPTELLYLPGGTHNLVRPADRMTSQQGNVEWFDFWLNGREDSAPEMAEQYRRWEKLCDRQRTNDPDRSTFCVPSKAH